jgi:Domain of unknown function (DUF4431)
MRLASVVVGVLITMLQSELVAAHCLQYQPVSLAGTLVRQTYPGPPDYESVTQGDRPEEIWVLLLDEFICVEDSYPYSREYGQREIQLVLGAEQYEQYRGLLGKRVIVSGPLRPGGGAKRYRKRLVIEPDEITIERVRP